MAEPGSNSQVNGPHVDVVRAVRLCHPDWESASSVTFKPRLAKVCWNDWRDEILIPILFSRLQAAQVAAATGNRKELLVLDKEIQGCLPVEMAERSRRAGCRLANAYPAPPAEKLWRHYVKAVEDGETPGNLSVILAVRAAAFHVVPRLLVGAYVFVEARGGLGEKGVSRWMEMVDDCLRASAKLETSGLRAA